MSYNLLFGISPHPAIKRKSQIIPATHACSSSLTPDYKNMMKLPTTTFKTRQEEPGE